MYEVCIYTKDITCNPNYDGCAISLPASKAEIEDALQRARVCGKNNYVLEFLFWPEFLIPILENCEPTIEEANVLATGIFTFDEFNIYKYEAVIRFLPELTMRSLINAAFSLERFEFYAGIQAGEELGAFAIEMDILPVLESLPEEIYDLLSEKKVGTYMVEQENGVFTEEGYCFRFEEGWNDVYDEKIQNFKEESNCPILICLEVGEKGGYREAWIGLPYREESIRESREYLSAEIGGECRFEKVQSVISQLEKMRFSFQDIEKLNLLAQSLLEEEGKNIWKYKALLETESPASVEELIELKVSFKSYMTSGMPSFFDIRWPRLINIGGC